MDKIPGMKNKMFNRLATAESTWENVKGAEGIEAGRNARNRLRDLR